MQYGATPLASRQRLGGSPSSKDMWGGRTLGPSLISYRHETDKSDNRSYGAPTDETDNDKTDNTTLPAGTPVQYGATPLASRQRLGESPSSLKEMWGGSVSGRRASVARLSVEDDEACPPPPPA